MSKQKKHKQQALPRKVQNLSSADQRWISKYWAELAKLIPLDTEGVTRLVDLRVASLNLARSEEAAGAPAQSAKEMFGSPLLAAQSDCEELYGTNRSWAQQFPMYDRNTLIVWSLLLAVGTAYNSLHDPAGFPLTTLFAIPLYGSVLFFLMRFFQSFTWGRPAQTVTWLAALGGVALALFGLKQVHTSWTSEPVWHFNGSYLIAIPIAGVLTAVFLIRRGADSSRNVLDKLENLSREHWLARIRGLSRWKYGLPSSDRAKVLAEAEAASENQPKPSLELGVPDAFLREILLTHPTFLKSSIEARTRRGFLLGLGVMLAGAVALWKILGAYGFSWPLLLLLAFVLVLGLTWAWSLINADRRFMPRD
ncbi:hypothetical protein BK816_08075 [Boudabousia tangfeifanii]|uniref:Uncharacterized protein n=1 Tax=Boudabousia tangfeifanii TaxID=1912795 RepID=A0A1D9MLU0_9ACTO|nr:hypothetical protein [Boudabousia tangfeifanii]AOZ73245.1 hypothetical protein BK816_08075 [Boudabousia tangfeifanii]